MPGYYRYPTLHDEQVVFVSEDDLWSVPAGGGRAHRLTAGLGEISHPCFSPDGRWLALVGREEGAPEVYVMPAAGGPSRRVTFLGASALRVVGWDERSEQVWFASNHRQPFAKLWKLAAVPRDGGLPEPLPYGPASHVARGPQGGLVLGRNTHDPARWKRYRGGTCGYLWIDSDGEGQFRRLLQLEGNMASPVWIGDRIYFLSDHEGIGNLYSCRTDGDDLQRHTDHDIYYARNAAGDSRRIVYHAGGELYLFDPALDSAQRIEVDYPSPRTQRNRKFVSGPRYLESFRLHPQGHSLAITLRGKPFTLGTWEGPVVQHGEPDGVRYRLASWLSDGRRVVAIGDDAQTDVLHVFAADAASAPQRCEALDLGRAVELVVAPHRDEVLIANHRGELLHVDLAQGTGRRLDHSVHGRLLGCAWSPDGRWVAYGFPDTAQTSVIKLCRLADGESFTITSTILRDMSPSFDPEGKYLYFLSHRVFDPVYDNLQFDLNFPRGMKPYLLTLQKETPSPFRPRPGAGKDASPAPPAPGEAGEPTEKPPLVIDLEGIQHRLVPFPIAEGKYAQLRGLPKNRVLFLSQPVEGSLKQDWSDVTGSPKATLEMYDLGEQKQETWQDDVSSFDVSADGQMLALRSGQKLRVVKAGEKPKADAGRETPSRKNGWVALDRIRVEINPPREWKQMYREAWRLQRDHFWSEDMSEVDWQHVYERYLPLVDQLGTRAELSDLIWEMQGELGTSHAYEMGGDYRQPPRYHQGFLGADFVYDGEADGYRLTHIVAGDTWDEPGGVPLRAPGVCLEEGDVLLAINGRRLGNRLTPAEVLVHQSGTEVLLTILRDGTTRQVPVMTLKNEMPARYREWVESNRRRVLEATQGRIGYVHIPNMGPLGYAEFHRYYLTESQRDGLLVDVRYNGGGHVSQLILEKLLRRRLGYAYARWGEPEPYPAHSLHGPLVALTNELAGSDGDIFSHCFKLLGLGPLIGKRTWGGVVGIWPRQALVDGGVTTQPEFSFWFEDVGWGVENYGTDPDIDVDITPQDDAAGNDPQLERAIGELLQLLERKPPVRPPFDGRPLRRLPHLPPRPRRPLS